MLIYTATLANWLFDHYYEAARLASSSPHPINPNNCTELLTDDLLEPTLVLAWSLGSMRCRLNARIPNFEVRLLDENYCQYYPTEPRAVLFTLDGSINSKVFKSLPLFLRRAGPTIWLSSPISIHCKTVTSSQPCEKLCATRPFLRKYSLSLSNGNDSRCPFGKLLL